MNLSIIIPVFNTEKYLLRCYNSIISNQNFKNYEIIFVNDGSTDNSLQVLTDIKKNDKNIVLLTQENKGQSIARNVGIQHAKGDYLMFLDSDDFVLINEIKDLLNFAYNKNIEIVSYKYKCVDDCGNEIKQEIVHKLQYNTILTGLEALNNGFQPSSACLFLFKRNLLIDNKIFFYPNILSEDVEFTIRVLLHAKSIYFSEVEPYYYCFTPGSTKRTKSKEKIYKYLFDQIYVAELIKKNIKDIPNLDLKTKTTLLRLSNVSVFSLLLVFLTHYRSVEIVFVKKCLAELKEKKLYPLSNHLNTPFQKMTRYILNIEKLYIFLVFLKKKIISVR